MYCHFVLYTIVHYCTLLYIIPHIVDARSFDSLHVCIYGHLLLELLCQFVHDAHVSFDVLMFSHP